MKIDKLLMSCRKNIFPENRIKRNKLFSTLSIVKLENDNYELTEEEKRNIFMHVITAFPMKKLRKFVKSEHYHTFPYSVNHMQAMEKIFKKAKHFLKNQLRSLRKK